MTARMLLPVNPDGGKEPTGSGDPGPPGEGVPTGGTTGQSLVKSSNADFDDEWGGPMASLLDLGTVANELADLTAALGDPDQIAWGAEWAAAGQVLGVSGGDFMGFLTGLPGAVGAAQSAADAAQSTADTAQIAANAAQGAADSAQGAADGANVTAVAASDAAAAAGSAAADATVVASTALAQSHHIAFEIEAATTTPLGHTGFGIIELQADAFDGAVRTSEGDVDCHVTFAIPGPLQFNGGLWTFTLSHFTGPDCGIYSIETTDDFGATWDVKATVDGYAAVGEATQTVVTGIAVLDGNDSIRIRMGSKNGSSSSFIGHISTLSGYFVFT